MKTIKVAKIMELKRRAIKESQNATDKIFKRYSKLINQEIAKAIPKGTLLSSGNGMCSLHKIETGEEILDACYWSRFDNGNPKLEKIAGLQYGTDSNELQGNFKIEFKINSTN